MNFEGGTKSRNLIWILDSDEGARVEYRQQLEIRFKLRFFESLSTFTESLKTDAVRPNLIISDLRFSDGCFLECLREDPNIKGISVLVVSNISDLDILRECFHQGALDYLTKPYDVNELIVKIERILNQVRIKKYGTYVDSISQQIRAPEGITLQLTTRELQIFHCLYRNTNKEVARDILLKEVWKEVYVTPKTLDVHLFNLRKKIKRIGMQIRFIAPESYILSINQNESNQGLNQPQL